MRGDGVQLDVILPVTQSDEDRVGCCTQECGTFFYLLSKWNMGTANDHRMRWGKVKAVRSGLIERWAWKQKKEDTDLSGESGAGFLRWSVPLQS